MRSVAAFVCLLGLCAAARGGELDIRPQRKSLHAGETISCTVSFKREHGNPRSPKKWKYWSPYGEVLRFPFRAEKPGTQDIGPVSVTIGDETVTADAVPVLVLPNMGTNDFFEIRVYDREIRTNETVEVVVQWRQRRHVPDPYYKADFVDPHPFHLARIEETDDWKLRSRYRDNSGGRSGQDDKGRYIIEGRLEVYEFAPKRAGALKITKEQFRNLPPDYAFEPRTIIVKE